MKPQVRATSSTVGRLAPPLLRSLGGRGFSPGANRPKTILPTIPFSALTNAPVISTGMNDSFRFSLRGRAEHAFCVPCASPGRRDLGNMPTPPHPSKPPLFFPEPTHPPSYSLRG